MDASDASTSSSACDDEADGEEWEQGGDGYSIEYALWMLKFVCPVDDCGGTLAPPNPTADFMEVSKRRRACYASANCPRCLDVSRAPTRVRSATIAATRGQTRSFTSTSKRARAVHLHGNILICNELVAKSSPVAGGHPGALQSNC